jgi:hypothetical protein
MSEQRIIYQTEDGGVAVIIPSAEALAEHSIYEIANKDVPHGAKYKIVTTDDVPSDRTFRGAWEVEEANLTDGTGSASNTF